MLAQVGWVGTGYRSVILEPKSQLKLTDVYGEEYKLENTGTDEPICQLLPDESITITRHRYQKLA